MRRSDKRPSARVASDGRSAHLLQQASYPSGLHRSHAERKEIFFVVEVLNPQRLQHRASDALIDLFPPRSRSASSRSRLVCLVCLIDLGFVPLQSPSALNETLAARGPLALVRDCDEELEGDPTVRRSDAIRRLESGLQTFDDVGVCGRRGAGGGEVDERATGRTAGAEDDGGGDVR